MNKTDMKIVNMMMVMVKGDGEGDGDHDNDNSSLFFRASDNNDMEWKLGTTEGTSPRPSIDYLNFDLNYIGLLR